MVAGVLGIMASGAACLPIDAAQPRERMLRILEDSGCEALVSDDALAAAGSLPVFALCENTEAANAPLVGYAQLSDIVGDLKPGTHTFRAEKGRQFQPIQKPLELTAGQTSDLDLRLTALPVPVEIRKMPPDSTVTYTRSGDPAVRPFTGTRQDLPEGDYKFTADADGYLQRVALEHISWDSVHPIDLKQDPAPASFTVADWGKGVWTAKTSYSERNGAGFVLFPKALGFVQFAIHLQGGMNHPQWLLHYVNERNYIRCEIDDDGFQAVRISETKQPEVLTRKKGVPKQQWYAIKIVTRSDGATLSLHKDATWETLGDVSEPGFAETKFGFYVPTGQQLQLANFNGRAFR